MKRITPLRSKRSLANSGYSDSPVAHALKQSGLPDNTINTYGRNSSEWWQYLSGYSQHEEVFNVPPNILTGSTCAEITSPFPNWCQYIENEKKYVASSANWLEHTRDVNDEVLDDPTNPLIHSLKERMPLDRFHEDFVEEKEEITSPRTVSSALRSKIQRDKTLKNSRQNVLCKLEDTDLEHNRSRRLQNDSLRELRTLNEESHETSAVNTGIVSNHRSSQAQKFKTSQQNRLQSVLLEDHIAKSASNASYLSVSGNGDVKHRKENEEHTEDEELTSNRRKSKTKQYSTPLSEDVDQVLLPISGSQHVQLTKHKSTSPMRYKTRPFVMNMLRNISMCSASPESLSRIIKFSHLHTASSRNKQNSSGIPLFKYSKQELLHTGGVHIDQNEGSAKQEHKKRSFRLKDLEKHTSLSPVAAADVPVVQHNNINSAHQNNFKDISGEDNNENREISALPVARRRLKRNSIADTTDNSNEASFPVVSDSVVTSRLRTRGARRLHQNRIRDKLANVNNQCSLNATSPLFRNKQSPGGASLSQHSKGELSLRARSIHDDQRKQSANTTLRRSQRHSLPLKNLGKDTSLSLSATPAVPVEKHSNINKTHQNKIVGLSGEDDNENREISALSVARHREKSNRVADITDKSNVGDDVSDRAVIRRSQTRESNKLCQNRICDELAQGKNKYSLNATSTLLRNMRNLGRTSLSEHSKEELSLHARSMHVDQRQKAGMATIGHRKKSSLPVKDLEKDSLISSVTHSVVIPQTQNARKLQHRFEDYLDERSKEAASVSSMSSIYPNRNPLPVYTWQDVSRISQSGDCDSPERTVSMNTNVKNTAEFSSPLRVVKDLNAISAADPIAQSSPVKQSLLHRFNDSLADEEKERSCTNSAPFLRANNLKLCKISGNVHDRQIEQNVVLSKTDLKKYHKSSSLSIEESNSRMSLSGASSVSSSPQKQNVKNSHRTRYQNDLGEENEETSLRRVLSPAIHSTLQAENMKFQSKFCNDLSEVAEGIVESTSSSPTPDVQIAKLKTPCAKKFEECFIQEQRKYSSINLGLSPMERKREHCSGWKSPTETNVEENGSQKSSQGGSVRNKNNITASSNIVKENSSGMFAFAPQNERESITFTGLISSNSKNDSAYNRRALANYSQQVSPVLKNKDKTNKKQKENTSSDSAVKHSHVQLTSLDTQNDIYDASGAMDSVVSARSHGLKTMTSKNRHRDFVNDENGGNNEKETSIISTLLSTKNKLQLDKFSKYSRKEFMLRDQDMELEDRKSKRSYQNRLQNDSKEQQMTSPNSVSTSVKKREVSNGNVTEKNQTPLTVKEYEQNISRVKEISPAHAHLVSTKSNKSISYQPKSASRTTVKERRNVHTTLLETSRLSLPNKNVRYSKCEENEKIHNESSPRLSRRVERQVQHVPNSVSHFHETASNIGISPVIGKTKKKIAPQNTRNHMLTNSKVFSSVSHVANENGGTRNDFPELIEAVEDVNEREMKQIREEMYKRKTKTDGFTMLARKLASHPIQLQTNKTKLKRIEPKPVNAKISSGAKMYKKPRVLKSAYWVNDRLYQAVIKAFSKDMDLRYTLPPKQKAEEFIIELYHLVNKVLRYKKKGLNPFIRYVMKHLYDGGLIKSSMNFLVFCMEYLPESFIKKALRDPIDNDTNSQLYQTGLLEDMNL